MSAIKRGFRAEQAVRLKNEAEEDPQALEDRRHRQLMNELAVLRKLIMSGAGQGGGAQAPALSQEDISAKIMEEFRAELSEAAKLKSELDTIYEAIAQTKKEIAALHETTGSEGEEMHRVTNELDAVVTGTEGATETILSAAEFIDETANTLSAHLEGRDQDMASDIQEKVVQIFEACNFQDLTGQRITKVVGTLRFIEDRITEMMDIWGGIESFNDVEAVKREERVGDEALLNGPALEEDMDVATQDDIDALFA
ncbi:putative methyl-accepting chemotaxis protein [Roseibium sp. TrichSKD4]|uniref:protein phosphatase CheZ n=1 Tax=Roseibium sp. TrichSKD4 TaxID=744980 RepID=UPI0001E56302|nr:protein phosphatase CheZ [Roseibium sp. TrichSKD4]EFO34553.1 putative methyl-accepting chemotaxis protein [Roseibium sp. TrichSKD4]